MTLQKVINAPIEGRSNQQLAANYQHLTLFQYGKKDISRYYID